MPDEPEKSDALEAFFRETVRAELLPKLMENFYNANYMCLEDDFKILPEQMVQKGIHRVAALRAGSYAITLRIPNHQIMRISSISKESRLFKNPPPMLLKPLTSWEVGPYRIEIFPEVNTKDVKLHHVEALEHLAIACGYHFWDVKAENIGLLENGVPVIIDPGAVVEDNMLFSDEATNLWNGLRPDLYRILKEHRGGLEFFHDFKNSNLSEHFKRDYDSLGILSEKAVAFKTSYENVLTHIGIIPALYEKIKKTLQHQEVIDSYFRYRWANELPGSYYENPHAAIDPACFPLKRGGAASLPEALKYAQEFITKHYGISEDRTYMGAFDGKQSLVPDMRKDLESLFSTAMQQHLDKHGLEYGRISGVFDEERMNQYLKATGRIDENGKSKDRPKSNLKGIIEKYGLPQAIVGQVLLRAAERAANDEITMMDGTKDAKWQSLVEDELKRAQEKAKGNTPPK